MNKKRLQSLILAFLTGVSIFLGWGASHGLDVKSVDKATGNYVIGEELYLKTCASCHIPIPPAVLPNKTWQSILENPGNHYGVQIKDLNGFNQRLMWQYLQQYSRSLFDGEAEPKYLAQSRYFFALHPQVKFSASIKPTTCIECHKNAPKFDYSLN
jgi:Dihaem cytochrome c